MVLTYPSPQPGASLLLSFNPSNRLSSRNTICFLTPNRLTAIRSFTALEAGYRVLVGASIGEVWDGELLHRESQGQIERIEWNLDERADKEEWENWFDGLDRRVKKEIMLIVLNDTIPLGPAPSVPTTQTAVPRTINSQTPISDLRRRRRTFASALAFREAASDWNYLVNVADAPTLSDFTWPITHRFNLSSASSSRSNADPTVSSITTSTIDSKSPLQLALTTNSSVCRLASRIKREIVAALPETIGSAVLAVANLRKGLIAEADDYTRIMEEKEGWEEEEENQEGVEAINQPVQQLSSKQAEALDVYSGAGAGRVRDMHSAATIVEERALSPCRARAASRSRSRSTGGQSFVQSESVSFAFVFMSTMSQLTLQNHRSSAASRLSTISSAPSSIHTISSPASSGWTSSEAQQTRMRYIAQISEYWPIDRLAQVNLASLLSSVPATPTESRSASPPLDDPTTPQSLTPIPALSLPLTIARHPFLLDSQLSPPVQQNGRIILLGTGPGSPLLLTRLAHLFLTSPPGSPYHVDLFLSDKLVPQEILAMIPTKERRDGVMIARKYPGNAEHAQDELMRLAIEGARAGKTVLRMKQGDPYLYGRGGEEVLCFREAGFEALVIPGLSSCLAGPTIAGIPVTQRGVAESMVLCTGVGRGGRDVKVDGYERGKTLVVLMGVARLDALIESLINHKESPYPAHLPIALIERASSPDQRVISSTLENISAALKRLSAHRSVPFMSLST